MNELTPEVFEILMSGSVSEQREFVLVLLREGVQAAQAEGWNFTRVGALKYLQKRTNLSLAEGMRVLRLVDGHFDFYRDGVLAALKRQGISAA